MLLLTRPRPTEATTIATAFLTSFETDPNCAFKATVWGADEIQVALPSGLLGWADDDLVVPAVGQLREDDHRAVLALVDAEFPETELDFSDYLVDED